MTGAVCVRDTDPCAFEIAEAACRRDSDCAMTGDARVAMAVAARITFRLVLIVDLTHGFLVAPVLHLNTYSAGNKTAATHEIVLSNIVVMAI